MLQVTCAIIIQKNKILIAQNGETSDHPFKWEFPGGKIKIKETAENCIIREILEELNLNISVERQLTSVLYDYGFKQIELIPYLCKIKSGDIVLREHISVTWVDRELLSKIDFSEADKKLILLESNQYLLEKYIGK